MTKTVESAANTYTETETKTPVRDNLIMEVLAVEFEINTLLTNSLQGNHTGAILQIGQKASTDSDTINNRDKVSSWRPGMENIAMEATETGTGGASQPLVEYRDYGSAGGGKGFLIASPSLFLGIKGSVQIAARTATCRILYRLVKVSTEELIGLLRE